MAERRLALVAGTGSLVPRAIEAARQRGWTVRVMTLGPRPELAGEDPFEMKITRPDLALREVRRFGATHVCAVGGLHLSDRDREGLAAFTRASTGDAETGTRGDSALTRLGNKLLDILGIPFIGVHEIVADILAGEGHLAGPAPDELLTRTLRFAFDTARRAGTLDLGQAVLVSGARVIATEDIGGTDLLLARGAAFRDQGLVGTGASPLVLGKASKPGQPTHIDLPAIGPDTIEGAARAGVRGMAIQTGRTLVIDREAVGAAADRAGVTLWGYEADRA